jgi:8-oxo-dGTP pyrophosphatase MutT (NUDIX family)
MSLVDDAVRTLDTWVAPDHAQERLRLEFMAHLSRHPDGMSRSCAPDHITASLLVVAPGPPGAAVHDQVLLTLHARTGSWLQFGGHAEPEDTTLVGAALREGREESGIDDLALVAGGPLLLDAHQVNCRNPDARRHLDVQYLALANAAAMPHVSNESLDVRWFPADAVPADRSVVDLISAARARLDAQPTLRPAN